jgi:hypothetical protein
LVWRRFSDAHGHFQGAANEAQTGAKNARSFGRTRSCHRNDIWHAAYQEAGIAELGNKLDGGLKKLFLTFEVKHDGFPKALRVGQVCNLPY